MLGNSTNTGSTATLTISVSGMIPGQQPNGKRKAVEGAEMNPLVAAAKRLKKDKSTSKKRKMLNAEETPSGLLIVRAPSTHDSSASASQPIPSTSSHTLPPPRPSSSQLPPSHSRTSPSPSPFTSSSAPSSSQQPPTKKFRSSSAQPNSSSRHPHAGGSRATYSPIPEENEVEEDVRAMNDEANSLRSARKSMSSVPTMMDQNLNPAFNFSRPHENDDAGEFGMGVKKKKKGKAKEVIMDTSTPIEQDETPQIQRNKRLREGAMAAIVADRERDEEGGDERSGRGKERGKERRADHRRRSSLSRGKRISSGFDLTGIISSPHNSVSETSFYKHIDCDLPDSERLRQLLIWSTIRASGTTTFSSSSTPSKPLASTSSSASSSSASAIISELEKKKAQLPPLSEKARAVLRNVQDDLVRQLAERKVDLSLFGGVQQSEDAREGGKKLKENEQNLKNKEFEIKYSREIRGFEEEEDQWKKVSYRYEEYCKRFSQAMDRRLAEAEAAAAGMSEKMRGKQRMIEREEELDEMLPDSHDLPLDLRRSLDLARVVLLSSHPSTSSSSHPSSSRHARTTDILTTHRGASLTSQELTSQIEQLLPLVTYKLDRLHSFVNAAQMTTRVAEQMLDERFRLLVGNLERRRPDSGSGSGGSGADDVIQKETAPLYIRDARPSTSQGESGRNVQGGSGVGGGLMDLMRALSRIDTARHPSQIGDSVRRAAREVQRIGDSVAAGSGGGGGGMERRLTAVYPAGILSSGAGGAGSGGAGGSVVMTPRKTPGTPRRYGTPGRERERTPGR